MRIFSRTRPEVPLGLQAYAKHAKGRCRPRDCDASRCHGTGVSLRSDATIATLFPEVVFRPISGGDEMLQFSAVCASGSDNPELRRFLSLPRIRAKKKNQRPQSTPLRNPP